MSITAADIQRNLSARLPALWESKQQCAPARRDWALELLGPAAAQLAALLSAPAPAQLEDCYQVYFLVEGAFVASAPGDIAEHERFLANSDCEWAACEQREREDRLHGPRLPWMRESDGARAERAAQLRTLGLYVRDFRGLPGRESKTLSFTLAFGFDGGAPSLASGRLSEEGVELVSVRNHYAGTAGYRSDELYAAGALDALLAG